MDDIVKAALKKWPHVPACHGWLALDARGQWYMRDDRTQAAGPFPQVKGSRIEHEKLREFIVRNYERDEQGCWYFQNGPQRVYVELEAAPWVWRLAPGQVPQILDHAGSPQTFQSGWLDERGRLFLETSSGFGLVHSLDMVLAAQAVEEGHWPVAECPFGDMPRRWGYVLSPAAQQAGPG